LRSLAQRPTNINPTRDVLPLAAMLAGTFAAGALTHDRQLTGTGWDMGEAVVLASLSAQALKLVASRERPNSTTSPGHFRHGGSSFPSGHTTVAGAALGMVPLHRGAMPTLAIDVNNLNNE
jgi:membrane-associated phospholipid phosphatase